MQLLLCLNPCSNGMSPKYFLLVGVLQHCLSLNPCSNGMSPKLMDVTVQTKDIES